MTNKVSTRLNPYLSNLVVSFAKFHDLHWFVKGRMFVQIHQYTESRYDDFAEKFDEVAEKVIMKGEKPVSTLREYLELATVKELDKKDYTEQEVLNEVLHDTELLYNQAKELRESFDQDGEYTVVAMLEEHIAGYEKELWFIRSIMK